MKRTVTVIVLGVVAFAAILLARLPASWLLPRGNANFSWASVEGSLWSGYCSGLTVRGAALGDLTWQLRPSRLLVGKLAAHVDLEHPPAASAKGDIEMSLDLALARVTGKGVVSDLQGRIEAHDLVDHSGYVTPLGNFAVTFPGGGSQPTGTLQDIGGPLAVAGQLVLTPQPGYDLSGYVTPRASATQALVNAIEILGSPDAQGRRPFGMSGTY